MKVFKIETDELVFDYTDDLEPEVMDCVNYFTIFYNGEDEDGNPSDCQCDYPADKYYYKM